MDPDAYVDASRLGCQIVVTEEMDGMVVTLPESVHNIMELPLFMRKR
jgi:hypothetical protein